MSLSCSSTRGHEVGTLVLVFPSLIPTAVHTCKPCIESGTTGCLLRGHPIVATLTAMQKAYKAHIAGPQ